MSLGLDTLTLERVTRRLARATAFEARELLRQLSQQARTPFAFGLTPTPTFQRMELTQAVRLGRGYACSGIVLAVAANYGVFCLVNSNLAPYKRLLLKWARAAPAAAMQLSFGIERAVTRAGILTNTNNSIGFNSAAGGALRSPGGNGGGALLPDGIDPDYALPAKAWEGADPGYGSRATPGIGATGSMSHTQTVGVQVDCRHPGSDADGFIAEVLPGDAFTISGSTVNTAFDFSIAWVEADERYP